MQCLDLMDIKSSDITMPVQTGPVLVLFCLFLLVGLGGQINSGNLLLKQIR